MFSLDLVSFCEYFDGPDGISEIDPDVFFGTTKSKEELL
jgi:hypothetical protein